MQVETKTIVSVPVLNDLDHDVQKLGEVIAQVRSAKSPVLDFKECSFVRPAAVATLGALVQERACLGQEIYCRMGSFQPDVKKVMQQNGFASLFQGDWAMSQGFALPFQRFQPGAVIGDVAEYLADHWLPIAEVPAGQVDDLVSNMCEIVMNGLEHSGCIAGVAACGQYYPNKRVLRLAFVDLGVGIPSNVRNLRPDVAEDKLDGGLIQWAFGEGNSTSSGVGPRGGGLDALRLFTSIRRGALRIHSGGGFAKVEAVRDHFGRMNGHFPGTIVNVVVPC